MQRGRVVSGQWQAESHLGSIGGVDVTRRRPNSTKKQPCDSADPGRDPIQYISAGMVHQEIRPGRSRPVRRGAVRDGRRPDPP